MGKVSSYRTAIFRNKASLPFRTITELIGDIELPSLDYGCGKSIDYIFMKGDRYDPYWIIKPLKKNFYKTIFCTYVLNVVKEEETEEILGLIRSYLAPGGVAYITVRRDVKKDRTTSRGYQRNVVLDLEVLVEKKGCFCTYLLRK